MKAKEVRRDARESMSGKWGRFIAMNLILIAITVVATFVAMAPAIINAINSATALIRGATASSTLNTISSSIGSFALTNVLYIILLIFAVPLNYAFVENLMKLKRDENTKCTEFFGLIFKRFGRAWKVALWTMVKILVLYLIFLIGMLIYAFLIALSGNSGSEILMTIVAVVGVISIGLYMYLIIKRIFSLVLAQYIAVDNPELLAKQCVEKSMKLMNGYKWKYFCLNLSFIGWIILSELTFGMGFVFLTPYMQVSYISFYEKILEEKNEPVVVNNVQ